MAEQETTHRASSMAGAMKTRVYSLKIYKMYAIKILEHLKNRNQ